MKTVTRFISIPIIIVALSTLGQEASAENPNDILIIANLTVPVDSLNRDDLKQIFLGQRTKWPGGQIIIPLHVAGDPALRASIRHNFLAMTAAEEINHWEDQKIRSGIKEPHAFPVRQILRAVFALKGSISYVYRKDHKPGVAKTLFIISAE